MRLLHTVLRWKKIEHLYLLSSTSAIALLQRGIENVECGILTFILHMAVMKYAMSRIDLDIF